MMRGTGSDMKYRTADTERRRNSVSTINKLPNISQSGKNNDLLVPGIINQTNSKNPESQRSPEMKRQTIDLGKGRNYQISRTLVDAVPEDPREYRDERKNSMLRTTENNAAIFGRRLASCSPTNFAKTEFNAPMGRSPISKAIYVQEAEAPEIVSTSILKPGMKLKDLPLVDEPGTMASKRTIDKKGMYAFNYDKVSRFDGHRSIYYSDKKRMHEPMHDSTSPMHQIPSPDRKFH